MRENGERKKKYDAQQTAGGPRKIFNPNNEYCRFLPQSAFPVISHRQAWGAKKCRAAWHGCACGGAPGGEHAWRAAVEHFHRQPRPASTSHELQAGQGVRRRGQREVEARDQSGTPAVCPGVFFPMPFQPFLPAVSSSFLLLHLPERCEPLSRARLPTVSLTGGAVPAQQPEESQERRGCVSDCQQW